MHVSPARRVVFEIVPATFFPYGKTRSRNVLKDYESRPAASNIKVLFLSCDDIHKALQTTASQFLNPRQLHYHINKNNLVNVARNLLIVKIISSPTFDPMKSEDLEYIWEVWYGVYWSSQDIWYRFKKDVKSLINGHLPETVELYPNKCLQSIKNIWIEWHSSINSKKPDYNLETKLSERTAKNLEGWRSGFSKELTEKEGNVELIRSIVDHMVVEHFPHDLKTAISFEAYNFFFELESDIPIGCKGKVINPTMLDPRMKRWTVHHTACPFNSYLPLPLNNELDPQRLGDGSAATHYCQSVLQKLLHLYQIKKEKIKWVFHFGDPIELCYTLTELFDAIDCSGLSDEVGLANVLNAAGRRLSEEPESVLLLETSTWARLAPTVIHYLEEALCAPLVYMPTLYGLRLADPLHIGASVRPESSSRTTVCLTFKRTQSYQNLKLDFVSSLHPWLTRLARQCFAPGKQPSEGICGMESYTPMTFFYVVGSAAQRMDRGCDTFRQVQTLLTELDETNLLAWRTMCQWIWLTMFPLIGATHLQPDAMARIQRLLDTYPKVLLCWTTVPFHRIETKSFYDAKTNLMGPPKLRLWLIPHDAYEDMSMDKPLDLSQCVGVAHCIDNVLLRFNKDRTSGWVTVSFPLVSDHGLSETHSGVVVDIQTGLPLIPIGPVRSLQAEPFTQPHPFADPGSTLPDEIIEPPPLNQTLSMSVISCLEEELQYIIVISCYYKDEREDEGPLNFVPGLTWFVDRQPPCESAHHITLVLDQSFGSETLALSVPYPFIAETVVAMPTRPGEFRLLLQKAVNEPWPAQFSRRRQPVLSNFHLDDLDIHLEQQFDSIQMPPGLSSLNEIRHIITRLFDFVVKEKATFFMVENSKTQMEDDESNEPDWYFRVHPPIVSNENGHPMLMLSAFDSNLAPKLIFKKKSTAEEVTAEFERVYSEGANQEAKSIPCLVTSSTETSQLLRYILRLNSTKIGREIKEHGPISFWPFGENSPWLATFLSPCYSDRPRSISDIWSELLRKKKPKYLKEEKNTDKVPDMDLICASCQQVAKKAKRCGRCKVVYYCDSTCQKKDWVTHKRVCIKSLN